MSAHRTLVLVSLLAVMSLGLAAPGASAQTTDIRMACMSSARLLCPKEVAAMDRRAAQACLIRNLAKATPGCREAVDAYRAQHPNGQPG